MSSATEHGTARGRLLLVAGPGPERDQLRRELEQGLPGGRGDNEGPPGGRRGESQDRYDVVTVDDDAEAFRRVQTWSPSVVVMELDRRGGDGPALCRQIKNDPRCGFVPVLLTTSRADTDAAVAAGLEAGADDVLFLPCAPAVLQARLRTHQSLYEAQVKLRQLVITDDLTGLFSRRFLFESMRHLAKQISRGGPPVLSCLMIDLDHFKTLNAEVGLVEADRVLKTVAQVIRRNTRDSDIVARFDGEEFAVILPSTSGNGARITAEKIRLAVERETRHRAPVTVSIGVSWCDLPVEIDKQSLLKPEDVILNVLKKADTALFQAKSQGRNRVQTQEDPAARESSGGVPILLEVIDQAGRQAYFSTELSATGLAIQQDAEIQDGDHLHLKLHLDDEVLEVEGAVVWTGPVTGAGRQSCIKFVEVPPPVQVELARFISGRGDPTPHVPLVPSPAWPPPINPS